MIEFQQYIITFFSIIFGIIVTESLISARNLIRNRQNIVIYWVALLHNSSCERIRAFLTSALPDPDRFRHSNARHSIQRGTLHHTFHILIIRPPGGEVPAKQCLESREGILRETLPGAPA